MQLSLPTAVVVLAALVGNALAAGETHTVRLINHCGKGTPKLVQGGKILSNGSDYTSFGPLRGAVAYLQTGTCGLNGNNCTLIDTTLENVSPGVTGSVTSINTNGSSWFNVPVSYSYYNGCDGTGAKCSSLIIGCLFTQKTCTADDVNLGVVFCG